MSLLQTVWPCTHSKLKKVQFSNGRRLGHLDALQTTGSRGCISLVGGRLSIKFGNGVMDGEAHQRTTFMYWPAAPPLKDKKTTKPPWLSYRCDGMFRKQALFQFLSRKKAKASVWGLRSSHHLHHDFPDANSFLRH